MATALNMMDLFRKTSIDPSRSAAKSGTLKMLFFSAFTPDQNADQYISDFVPATNEFSGTGYARLTLANVTFTMDASGNVKFDADDPSTTAQNASGDSDGRRVVIAYDTGTDATSEVVCFSDDTGANFGFVSGSLDCTISTSGIYVAAR